MLLALSVSAVIGWFVRLSGPAMWSGTFAAALSLGVVALNLAAYAWATRASPDAHAGVLVVWLLLSIATSIVAPGASYLFTWPLLFALIAARSGHAVAWWLAAAIALLLLAGLAYTVAAIMLGVAGPGAAALAVVSALIVWLVAPLLMRAGGGRRRSWPLPAVCAGAAVLLAIIGAATTSPSANEPLPSAFVFAQNADSGDGLFGSLDGRSAWTQGVIGPQKNTVPDWASALRRAGAEFSAKAQPRANLEAPAAHVLKDTLIDGARRVIIRVNAPVGTTALTVRVIGAPVSRTAIDARVADTTRFRRRSGAWAWTYWAVPDSGAVFSLGVPVDAHFQLILTARRPGLPGFIGLPARPADVVPRQTGDVSVVVREVRF
jgi:hypothetical protein